ncbi:MAG: EMC3/TMCO1 family protein [Planctomycetota bacterium]
MDLLAELSNWITTVMDVPLGWLAAIPRDLAMVIVAVGTSMILTLARKWTTDQDRLRRAKHDLKRLKQLKREAKRAKDKDAVKRVQTTIGMINVMKMKAEGKPLLVSIIPIAVLAIWCFGRLDYYPAEVGDEVAVKAWYPLSSISGEGKFSYSYLVPPPEETGIEMASSPIQEVVEDPEKNEAGETTNGYAEWTIRPTEEVESVDLVLRHEGQTATHPFSAGGWYYEPPLQLHENPKIEASQVDLTQYKFLGIVPGIGIGRKWYFLFMSFDEPYFLAPWIVAYLIIVIPFVPILRSVMKVY